MQHIEWIHFEIDRVRWEFYERTKGVLVWIIIFMWYFDSVLVNLLKICILKLNCSKKFKNFNKKLDYSNRGPPREKSNFHSFLNYSTATASKIWVNLFVFPNFQLTFLTTMFGRIWNELKTIKNLLIYSTRSSYCLSWQFKCIEGQNCFMCQINLMQFKK
jgi:hypothetical protein